MPLNRKIAYIDLSTGEVQTKPIPLNVRKKFLGGRGLDAYLLYNHTKKGCDPLGPGNVITVSSGLLGGSIAPAAARTHCGTKSPLTNGWGDAQAGGFWPAPGTISTAVMEMMVTMKNRAIEAARNS